MSEFIFVIPVILLGIAFYLNYRVYEMALKLYRNDQEKAGKLLRFGGERMLREDFDDPFYHNNQKELATMIQLRTYSIILVLASIIMVIILNVQHYPQKPQDTLPNIFQSERN